MAAEADVAAVDRFLAERKTLSGPPPEFGPSGHVRGKGGKGGHEEWQAKWPIANSLGVVTTGHLPHRGWCGRLWAVAGAHLQQSANHAH